MDSRMYCIRNDMSCLVLGLPQETPSPLFLVLVHAKCGPRSLLLTFPPLLPLRFSSPVLSFTRHEYMYQHNASFLILYLSLPRLYPSLPFYHA